MQATALSDKQPKSRTTLYLSIICTYLILIICAQFALIRMLKNETGVVSCNSLPKSSSPHSNHTLVKRQINRGFQVCPPGCVRRRRKRPFGAIARPESTIHPYSDTSNNALHGERGAAGNPGQSGQPVWPGESGSPGWPGESGQPGWPGESGPPGWPGESGQPGRPGESGQAGYPGESGQQGLQGPRGGQGSPGRGGLPGSPGGVGYPGSLGLAGEPGRQGQQGTPGGHGARGSPGAMGPPGNKGRPSSGSGSQFNYDTVLGPSLRSGQSRGDQYPTEQHSLTNSTSASQLLKEFRLYPHPECKDEVNHRALMNTLKDKGKVSFMILVDLQGSEYCIVHT